MKEWRLIKNYDNYKVSSDGEIKSVSGICFVQGNYHEYKRNRLQKPHENKFGYLRVSLSINNSPKEFLIHRLVAGAFIENPLNKPCVNHKDGNKHNNSVNNLEWCTYSENTRHAISTGLLRHAHGEQKPKSSKLKESQILEIYKLNRLGNLYHREIAEIFKVSRKCIGDILIGRNWKHLYKFK